MCEMGVWMERVGGGGGGWGGGGGACQFATHFNTILKERFYLRSLFFKGLPGKPSNFNGIPV